MIASDQLFVIQVDIPPVKQAPPASPYTASYFNDRHRRLMNTLSRQRPRPSIEQRIPAASNYPGIHLNLLSNFPGPPQYSVWGFNEAAGIHRRKRPPTAART